MKLQKTGLGLLAAFLLLLGASGPGLTATTSIVVPFVSLAFVPCAAGGAGEFVIIEGDLHIVNGVTLDQNGGLHGHISQQPMGAIGTGQTTGDIYRVTGGTRQQMNFNGFPPAEITFVENFKLIGPGPDNNFLFHRNTHVTVNANGDLTVDFGNDIIECL